VDPEIQQTERGFLTSLRAYLPIIVGVIVVLNLVFINGFVFFSTHTSKPELATIPKALTPTPYFVASQGIDITSQINQATESVKLQILHALSGIPLLTPTSAPTLTPTPTDVLQQASREYFVPLGSGFGSGTDWTTITQLGVTIDTANYSVIQTVIFEASVRIPTGNQTVWVRLLNADTYQSVSGSDLTLSGGTPTILVSSPISLSSGSHLYKVQLKTQLGYITYIDFARFRILVK